MGLLGGMSEVSAIERQLRRMVESGYPIDYDVRSEMVAQCREIMLTAKRTSHRLSAVRCLTMLDLVNVRRERTEMDRERPPSHVTLIGQIDQYAQIFAAPQLESLSQQPQAPQAVAESVPPPEDANRT